MVEQASESDAVTENRPLCAADMQEYDQCVFLRGYRVMDRKSHVLKMIKVKVADKGGGFEILQRPWVSRSSTSLASSSNSISSSRSGTMTTRQNTLALSMSSPETDDSQDSMEIAMNVPQTISPIEYLLAYVLVNSDAEIALAHDDDLAAIIKDREEYDDIAELIFSVAPAIVVDSKGVGSVSSTESAIGLRTPRPAPVSIPESVEGRPSLTRPSQSPEERRQSPNPSPEDKRFRKPQYQKTMPPNYDPVLTPTKPSKVLPPEYDDLKVTPSLRFERRRMGTDVGRSTSKFDRTPYDREQERIQNDIDTVQVQLAEVKGKIALLSTGGPGAEKEASLRLELDNLRNQQANSKAERITLIAEIGRLQEGIRKKVKDAQTMGRKLPAKSVTDLESQINAFEQRIEQGLLTFAEEKKAVKRISDLRRAKPEVESYMALGTSLARDRNCLADLQKALNMPTSNLSSKIDEIRTQLETLRKERDEFYASRGKLFAERDMLQKRQRELYNERRESTRRFQEAQEAFRQMAAEERAKEAEKARQRHKLEMEKKQEEGRKRLLEKAKIPVFQSKKRDCQTLLDFFAGYTGGQGHGKAMSTGDIPGQKVIASPTAMYTQSPQELSHRYTGGQTWDQWVPMKKKTEKEEDFFVGTKSGKGKKGRRAATAGAPGGSSSAASSYSAPSKVTVPLTVMNLLTSFEISPPVTTADIPKTVETVQKKLEWLDENEARETEQNVASVRSFLNRIGTPAIPT